MDEPVLCGLEHLHSTLYLLGLGQNHITAVLELELYLPEAPHSGLVLGDQLLYVLKLHLKTLFHGIALACGDEVP